MVVTSGVVLSDVQLPVVPEPSEPAWSVFHGEHQRVGAGQLFVRRAPSESSDAGTALFVHGNGGSSTNWTDLMALLATHLDCHAMDLPGFGHSSPPAGDDYRLGTHVRAVIDLLELRGGGRPVHLFGNSLGGAVCVQVAATRPDLVQTLTLVSPALPNRDPRATDPRLLAMLLPGARRAMRRRMEEMDARERALLFLRMCYHDPRRIPSQRIDEAAAEVRRRISLGVNDVPFSASLRGLVLEHLRVGPQSLWGQVASVNVPTLLVWGGHDKLVSVSIAGRAVRTFPDARLLVVEDAGHVAQMECPELVARAFLGMLESHSNARRSSAS